jgi:hypothetical protein
LSRQPNPTSQRRRRSGVIRGRTPRPPFGKHSLQSSKPKLTMEIG